MTSLPVAAVRLRAIRVSALGAASKSVRDVPEETPVALDYNGVTHAVMMATPADLEDFAIGFSLSEGIIASADEITELRVVPTEQGIFVRMQLVPERESALVRRRRHMAGPTGCGLCGLDSLAEAMREPPTVTAQIRVDAAEIRAAIAALADHQALNRATHAVHAAGFWVPGSGIAAVREDVGRHNALDKLAGSLARTGVAGGGGIVLLTSRVSVEMVQKAAILGAAILVAISAPTALAVRLAERAGITLVGIARDDGFELFCHPDRVAR